VREISVELPADVDSVQSARRAVDGLGLDADSEAAFNLRLLVSELVANSVRHADLPLTDTIRLEAHVHATYVRARVTDRGRGFTGPVLDQPPNGSSGRGLYLLDALADRWGTDRLVGRTQVWFELDLH
jgi:anti-sigma regulatory factor (Ser/Thr protein kinase)